MKQIFRAGMTLAMLALCSLLLAANADAEQKYVVGVTGITLREQPGSQRKIIEMVPVGSEVEVIEPGDEWSLVSSPQGNQGYVLTRFLSNQAPPSLELARLQEKYSRMMAQVADPAQEIARLEEQNHQLKTDLDKTLAELKALQADHEKLKTGSKDYVAIKSKFDEVQKELSEATALNQKLSQEVSRLKIHQNLRWFLTGAGVLLLGIIIGVLAKRRRRRSLSL
jgi:SH3 domain protein